MSLSNLFEEQTTDHQIVHPGWLWICKVPEKSKFQGSSITYGFFPERFTHLCRVVISLDFFLKARYLSSVLGQILLHFFFWKVKNYFFFVVHSLIFIHFWEGIDKDMNIKINIDFFIVTSVLKVDNVRALPNQKKRLI